MVPDRAKAGRVRSRSTQRDVVGVERERQRAVIVLCPFVVPGRANCDLCVGHPDELIQKLEVECVPNVFREALMHILADVQHPVGPSPEGTGVGVHEVP